ncbi:YebY family protein [Acidovorax sp. LjRoot118]|uniref:DUF2511 domain-containing protein n=1 Tax=Acidovorax sp. LjRoot118 TaxID=3342256 RepID=UPI003ECC5A3A
MHHNWANTFLQITLLGVCGVGIAQAQVKCTMPNGMVITQQLSDKCPAGAVKGETPDGKSISIAPPKPPTPAPRDPFKPPPTAAETLGDRWPLTVRDVVVRCEVIPARQRLDAVTVTHRGTTYAVNGIADAQRANRGWRDIAPIWKANPEIPGTKIGIGPLIDYGRQLCR